MSLKFNRKKAIILSAAVSLGLIVLVLWWYAHANTQHAYLDVDGDSPMAVYPFKRSIVDFGGGVRFSYDTGAYISTILPADLRRLKEMGMAVDSVRLPSFGVDHNYKSFLCSKMYVVELPVYDNKPDSLPENRTVVGRMRKVIFLPAPTTDTISTLGVDVIERFLCRYSPSTRTIAFTNDLPDGYEPLTDISAESTLATMLGCGKRYYVDMKVENLRHNFFINTSFPRVNVALPAEDTATVTADLRSSLLVSKRGSFRAKILDKAWVQLGDRAGNQSVFFANTGFPEKYVVNPMNFFQQDVIIDYPNRRILLRQLPTMPPSANVEGKVSVQ